MEEKKQNGGRVFIAMSGGVDSSVAALLLKNQGFEVVGVYMQCWSEADFYGNCSSLRDEEDARRVAQKLNIPFYVWDFEKEYRDKVYNYFINEYSAGRTPNPDVMCNKYIKFSLFLEKALKLGANYIATGHYVKKFQTPASSSDRGIPNSKVQKLMKAKDGNKDQSYFLWTLTQKQLRRCLFPVGGLLKSEVRDIAQRAGLPTASKKDSQGLCFVGKIRLAEFLKNKVPLEAGSIVSSRGQYLGEHKGVNLYTIGQRQGLGVGGGGPFFVVEKKPQENILVAVEAIEEVKFYKKEVLGNEVSWIDKSPSLPSKIGVKTRYRQKEVPATFNWQGDKLRVIFDKPQRALTPGQSVVFYNGEEMLGGAIIGQVI
jgi:tRNA-specific 2-thiouridylase